MATGASGVDGSWELGSEMPGKSTARRRADGPPPAERGSPSPAALRQHWPCEILRREMNALRHRSDLWGFRQWNAEDFEAEDVRYASVGQLSLTCWVNRPLRRLIVLNVVRLGQPPVTTT
ncbi:MULTISPECIES: hypothetical protein [Streptomyces]|uniref:hypothetical protein n=1 Tax=Streptomyces TaxID=1883 RepID=UPI002052A1BB|nr:MULTISPECIES: hypothetical protein [Streptomyces]UPT46746.1 hypothetical protein MWG59_38460 [Streptomyces sp. WAC00303]WIY80863.1 hypothetical protein QPM16_38090 [Streptomyces anulatus]